LPKIRKTRGEFFGRVNGDTKNENHAQVRRVCCGYVGARLTRKMSDRLLV